MNRAYAVEISATAQRQFKRLSHDVQNRLRPRIRALAEEPRPPGVIKLKGVQNEYRIRVGSYRVIYEIRDDVLVILILDIGHRRDIYR